MRYAIGIWSIVFCIFLPLSAFSAECAAGLKVEKGVIEKLIDCLGKLEKENNELRARMTNNPAEVYAIGNVDGWALDSTRNDIELESAGPAVYKFRFITPPDFTPIVLASVKSRNAISYVAVKNVTRGGFVVQGVDGAGTAQDANFWFIVFRPANTQPK